ncbi:MAG: class I SAM-dependent methyltransferase [Alphaproteobacteria bacterium]|nr:class I SAM-dependent methyltransferase [Alphaproteobacteria bacterium]
MNGDPVKAQYEGYPYPPRNPADEKKRLVVGSPSHLAEVAHYVFGGSLPRPLRVLVAGGGTGDSCVMLAQHLADRGAGSGEIVYLDLSKASRGIAEARVRARGLGNVAFHTASLLDLPSLGLGQFDYIDCCGVLHHLPDPAAGLATLAGALAPGGGLGLMVYASFGRAGVYEAQAALRLLAPAELGDAPRLAIARDYVAGLPRTNPLAKNALVTDHKTEGDAGIYDLFLHARDRAYTVPELAALLAGAGLRPTGWIEPVRYDPLAWLASPMARKRAEGLAANDAAALAELVTGNLKTHVVYALKGGNSIMPPSPGDPEAIPVWREQDPAALAKALAGKRSLRATLDGLEARFDLPAGADRLVAAIDGSRSVASLISEFGEEAWAALYRVLNGLNLLLLRRDA